MNTLSAPSPAVAEPVSAPAARPTPAIEAKSSEPVAKVAEDGTDKARTIAHDGIAFDLPAGFWHDGDAKGEVYRDGKRHHAVRLVIESGSGSAADWIAAKYPSAKTWVAKISGADLTFATQVGKSLRMTVAVIATGSKVNELACTSDDLTTEKTDEVCAKILRTFRAKPSEEGLPGE